MTMPSIPTWYAGLEKPFFSPPNWVFAPVWTVLYALMAVAFWRVWMLGRGSALQAAALAFAVQLILNVAWYLQHRYRTGAEVSQAVPYVVLGFAFQSDLLSGR